MLSRIKTKVVLATLVMLALALFGTLMYALPKIEADHGPLVTVFLPNDGDVYQQHEIAPWGIACHIGAFCTRDQVPGGLSTVHGQLKTDLVGKFDFVATGTLGEETVTVIHRFTVLPESPVGGGEISPQPGPFGWPIMDSGG